ncbi:hypothetical protein B0H17DRAFT_1083872 [Mycena rosella]|uniref:Uncharacterized protein n=1 Tax=Mycena rosella TaxID=1033263 RepID=A0AAD7D0A0_MYCRO|nr:hypothetical protein B0H17DRAFT_1083872 [Mycena rosella]
MALIPSLCVLLIFADHVKGQDVVIPNPRRILRSVVIASVIISTCFIAEMVAVAYLISRHRRMRDRRRFKSEALSSAEQLQPSPADDTSSDWKSLSHRAQVSIWPESSIPSSHDFGQRFSAAPSWSSDDVQSTINITVHQPSPLLHTQFPGTPETVPGTPVSSSNIFAGRHTWVAGGGLDRLTILPFPWQYPQSARGSHTRAISVPAVEGNTDGPLGAGQDPEKIALEQLVANLMARIRELENPLSDSEMQQKLERDASWCSSLPSYKSR